MSGLEFEPVMSIAEQQKTAPTLEWMITVLRSLEAIKVSNPITGQDRSVGRMRLPDFKTVGKCRW
jgi:hypothetical protein